MAIVIEKRNFKTGASGWYATMNNPDERKGSQAFRSPVLVGRLFQNESSSLTKFRSRSWLASRSASVDDAALALKDLYYFLLEIAAHEQPRIVSP